MITILDDTPQLIVAKSPYLQEQMVLDLIMQDDELIATTKTSYRYVVQMINEELQAMPLADSSALLANTHALKQILRNFGRTRDLPIRMYYDDYIPWLEEPLWKEGYYPDTGIFFYSNVQTHEKLSGEQFGERVKTERICQESIQFLSEPQRFLQFKLHLKNATIKVYQGYYEKQQKLKPLLPWERQRFMRVVSASCNQPRKDISPALRDIVYEMLLHLHYDTFRWYLGALVDHMIQYDCWQALSDNYKTQMGCPSSYFCDGTVVYIYKHTMYKLMVQTAYEVLNEQEKKKYSVEHYERNYRWLLEV